MESKDSIEKIVNKLLRNERFMYLIISLFISLMVVVFSVISVRAFIVGELFLGCFTGIFILMGLFFLIFVFRAGYRDDFQEKNKALLTLLTPESEGEWQKSELIYTEDNGYVVSIYESDKKYFLHTKLFSNFVALDKSEKFKMRLSRFKEYGDANYSGRIKWKLTFKSNSGDEVVFYFIGTTTKEVMDGELFAVLKKFVNTYGPIEVKSNDFRFLGEKEADFGLLQKRLNS